MRDFLNIYSFTLNDLWFESEERLLLATSRGLVELDISQQEAWLVEGTENLGINHITQRNGIFFFSTSGGMMIAGKEQKRLNVLDTLLKGKVVLTTHYNSTENNLLIGTMNNGGLSLFPFRSGKNWLLCWLPINRCGILWTIPDTLWQ
ncbi:MAG: hypothetical protein LUD15_04565 [Bacteroides sp.]|nr:hypothetical protein [Bacteroides sp.]